MYFVEEIAHMYRKKLQNTWQIPKKPSKETIKCPSKKLEEFFTGFTSGECYLFAGSQHYTAFSHFRAWLLHYCMQRFNVEIIGQQIRPEEDFKWLLSLESGISFPRLSFLEKADKDKQEIIGKAISVLRTKQVTWCNFKGAFYETNSSVLFFSVSLKEWQKKRFHLFSKIAKETKKLIFVFIYMDQLKNMQNENPYYLSLSDLYNEDVPLVTEEYGTSLGLVYPSWPMWKESWLEEKTSDITLQLHGISRIKRSCLFFSINKQEKLEDYDSID